MHKHQGVEYDGTDRITMMIVLRIKIQNDFQVGNGGKVNFSSCEKEAKYHSWGEIVRTCQGRCLTLTMADSMKRKINFSTRESSTQLGLSASVDTSSPNYVLLYIYIIHDLICSRIRVFEINVKFCVMWQIQFQRGPLLTIIRRHFVTKKSCPKVCHIVRSFWKLDNNWFNWGKLAFLVTITSLPEFYWRYHILNINYIMYICFLILSQKLWINSMKCKYTRHVYIFPLKNVSRM